MKTLSYKERSALADHPVSKKLFLLMEEKKTNLGLAADVTESRALIDLVHATGNHICVLKTHVDILSDFQEKLIEELRALAKKYRFLLFEDRKFADIGHTVQQQYRGGIYRIAEWADLVNAHILPGPGIITGLKQIGLPRSRGLLLLAQMSSKENLLEENYTAKAIALAKEHQDFVIGFIAQEKLTEDPRFVHLTPGVQGSSAGDVLGQQYVSPEKAIRENKTDVILVGRGIYGSLDPMKAAREYRQRGWQAYVETL